jgi:YD repeat-containing protein
MKTKIKYIVLLISISIYTQSPPPEPGFITTTYSYDNLNRLVQVVFNDGSTHDYVYDDLGNRIQLSIETLSIDSEILQNTITVYPNPTEEFLNIKIPESVVIGDTKDITIYDLNGRVINHIQPEILDNKITLKVDELFVGTYLIHLKTDTGTWSQIFIKK